MTAQWCADKGPQFEDVLRKKHAGDKLCAAFQAVLSWSLLGVNIRMQAVVGWRQFWLPHAAKLGCGPLLPLDAQGVYCYYFDEQQQQQPQR